MSLSVGVRGRIGSSIVKFDLLSGEGDGTVVVLPVEGRSGTEGRLGIVAMFEPAWLIGPANSKDRSHQPSLDARSSKRKLGIDVRELHLFYSRGGL